MFEARTNHESCPVRIMYTEVLTGSVIHASELDTRLWGLRPVRALAVIRCTEFSACSGTTVERSNYRVILGDCREGAHRPGLVQICGSHGYQALAYDATLGPVPADEELREWLEFVARYPIIDDDDHNELESYLEYEAWDDHGQHDFERAMIALMDADIDMEHEHEAPDLDGKSAIHMTPADSAESGTWAQLWRDLWLVGAHEFGINGGPGFAIESGGSVNFYVEEWIRAARAMHSAVNAAGYTRAGQRVHRIKLYGKILEIAEACRISAGK